MFGMCGDNCSYCLRFTATKSSMKVELEKAKELWVRLGLRKPDFPVKDMVCHGCNSMKKCAYTELRACVNGKGYENCGPCEEYPCNLINGVFDKTETLKSHALKVCTQEEMDILHKAFFTKKEYFDRIHCEQSKRVST